MIELLDYHGIIVHGPLSLSLSLFLSVSLSLCLSSFLFVSLCVSLYTYYIMCLCVSGHHVHSKMIYWLVPFPFLWQQYYVYNCMVSLLWMIAFIYTCTVWCVSV